VGVLEVGHERQAEPPATACPTCAEQTLVACRSYCGLLACTEASTPTMGSEHAEERPKGSRYRPSLREVRLQDALFLHRARQARLRAPRLRMHEMPEHPELCDSALDLR